MGPDLEVIVAGLRRSAVADPKEARTALIELFASGTAYESVFERLSGPGDGRIRQVVATVYRLSPDHRERLAPWLRKWHDAETDEFTRNAISRALQEDDGTPPPRTRVKAGGANALEAYRYVADRLCHRIRNALTLPSAQARRLEDLAQELEDDETRRVLLEIHRGIMSGLIRISRNVEFDVGDSYLTWQHFELVTWLEQVAPIFASRFGHARLQVACDARVRGMRIRGTPFLLETLFGNIWANAVQAAELGEVITLEVSAHGGTRHLRVLALDEGPGFPEDHLETAFQQVFSTKGTTRGRGLLEIADAATQMQGSVNLVRDSAGKYRIAVTLPLEQT